MKVFVDAYGDTAAVLIQLLVSSPVSDRQTVLVRTYDELNNKNLLNYLRINRIEYTFDDYNTLKKRYKKSFDLVLSMFARVMIPKWVYADAFASINIHPSLLPKYKGCFSVPWAIINNEKVTGVTFHELNDKFDEGKILKQYTIDITDDDTAYTLYSKIQSVVIKEYLKTVQGAVDGTIKSYDQVNSSATYYPRRLPFDGYICEEWNLRKIERFIRAMIYPPHAPAKLYTPAGDVFITSLEAYISMLGAKIE